MTEPPREALARCAHPYFAACHQALIDELPMERSTKPISYESTRISLPPWAEDLGVGEPAIIVVPAYCVCDGEAPAWQRVDWIRAALGMLTSQPERHFESAHGPSHSYAYRLPIEIRPQWERAWVNRICLFLRRWIARRADAEEARLFPTIPSGRVHLTHDVDYIRKTLPLRLKQTAFLAFNVLRAVAHLDMERVSQLARRMLVFGVGRANYWQFERILELEQRAGRVSSWFFYGGGSGWSRGPLAWLLDPSYDVSHTRVANQLRRLRDLGHRVGLHQSYYCWRDAKMMGQERHAIERALGSPVDACRQHWLRFSFEQTWSTQECAGLRMDMTLGFNERPGFRNSAALRTPAWLAREARFSDTLEVLPLVLMDSHLHDYGQHAAPERRAIIDRLLDEIAFVGGEATVVWHQRVFHPDYGWGEDYEYLLDAVVRRFPQSDSH
ncbi:MAG: hypothetical protein AAF493_00250 [Pseudomonadota bacterium]